MISQGSHSPQRQQGVAILLFVTILLLAVTTLLVTQLSVNGRKNQRTTDSVAALAVAKQALLGYAVAHNTPGTLPCPDNTGDGLENPQGLNCQSQLGLLPYRTLNLPELLDGAGARLWYAVDLNYVANAGAQKNSSITTNLNVSGDLSTAIIISPGAALDGQARQQLNRSDFLEGLNADADLTAYEVSLSDNQNDRLLPISAAQFWPLIEQRVLSSTASLLNEYRNQCGEYPWAADFGGLGTSTLNSQLGTPPLVSALPDNWGAPCGIGIAPTPPPWLTNHWLNQLQYRMCLTAEGDCLTIIDGLSSPVAGVLNGPGIPLGAQIRPDNDLNDYFEDENSSLPDNQFRRVATRNHSANYNDTTRALTP